jgi:hypothetical protein
MGTTTIPIELYKILEDKLGKEQATEVVTLYEQTTEAIYASVKISVKEDLKDELATKADLLATRAELKAEIALVRQEMQTIKVELEGKIAKLDQKLNFLVVLMIIALTLMNPVAAELIKGLLKL